MKASTQPTKGFTLIEVMVALTIVAFSLTAVAASMSQMIDAATTMRDRTYASWIAQNKITEIRLANTIPEVGTSSGEIEFGNTDWEWRVAISDVSVSLAGEEYVIRTVTGFVGEPVVVGRRNGIFR